MGAKVVFEPRGGVTQSFIGHDGGVVAQEEDAAIWLQYQMMGGNIEGQWDCGVVVVIVVGIGVW